MKLTSDAYEYSLEQRTGGGVRISLFEVPTGKMVPFYLADASLSLDRLLNHMDSLTDELCAGQWFKEVLTKEERKAKQKADKEAKKAAIKEQ